ncbi:very short patch repair endonuclease [Micromonospora sp. NPDC007271]|uniref:very short patch repair endonuclease n=1 Tax=Micromonospora sp. NPDC007271 TaxID=3154587 RepID=UPI0033EFDA8B
MTDQVRKQAIPADLAPRAKVAIPGAPRLHEQDYRDEPALLDLRHVILAAILPAAVGGVGRPSHGCPIWVVAGGGHDRAWKTTTGSTYRERVTEVQLAAETPIVVGPSPVPSSAGRRRAMQLQRSRDTVPEIALRKSLHRLGLRFRLHQRPLEGLRRTVDIVFRPAKVAVEVRGCFWHVCPEHGARPKSNAAWWDAKLSRNEQRDRETARSLEAAGWRLVVVWEHEDTAAAAERVAEIVRLRRDGTKRN